MFLGIVIGIERLWAHKTATMRTHALVSMGSAMFIVISEMLAQSYGSLAGFNPTQMAASVITGVGFLGAGLIIYHNSQISGVTTASGIWVSAGIGMAVGFGFYSLAIIATILTLFIFTVLWFIEQRLKNLPIGKD